MTVAQVLFSIAVSLFVYFITGKDLIWTGVALFILAFIFALLESEDKKEEEIKGGSVQV